MQIQPEKIRGIVFDVDGTLYYQLPIRIIVLSNLIMRNIFNPQRLVRVLRIIKCYREMQETVRKSFLHNCSFADLQLQMTADAVKEPAHCVQEIINEWMFKRPMPFLKYFIRSGLVNFIKMMKARDVRLGIYSDYPCDKKLQHMRIADYFAAIVSSFDPEVLKFKPDPRGFLIASEKLGLTPDEILFIGDRVNVDAAGAAHSGMQVVLVGGFLRTKGQVESYPRYRSFNDISREIFSRSSI